MHLTFNTTPDDVRDFAGYMYTHSKTLRRRRLDNLAKTLAVMIIVYFAFFRGEGTVVTLYWVSASILAIIAISIYSRRKYIQTAVEMYRERERGRESRSSTLTIADTGIKAVSEDAGAEFEWSAIASIEEFNDRTYIFTSPTEAIHIRHDAVTDGDYRTFIDTVKQRHRQQGT